MSSINKVFISGNLAQDSELKSTSVGTPILTFSVAVNTRRKNRETEQWDDFTTYVDCKMFGSRAEKIAQYLNKGTKAMVEGHLDKHSWTGSDGVKRSKMEVVVDDIDFSNRGRGGPSDSYGYTAPKEKTYSKADLGLPDDLPF